MPITSRAKHFKKYLGKLEETYRIRGGTEAAPFTVLEFCDRGDENGNDAGWVYVTDGVSDHDQPAKDEWSTQSGLHIELLLQCRRRSRAAIKVLEAMANFPFDHQSCLARGHVLLCDEVPKYGWTGYGLFAAGARGKDFVLPFDVNGRKIQVLALFPLLPIEVQYGTEVNGKRLEKLLLSRDVVPYYDKIRDPCVERKELQRDRAKPETDKHKPVTGKHLPLGEEPTPQAVKAEVVAKQKAKQVRVAFSDFFDGESSGSASDYPTPPPVSTEKLRPQTLSEARSHLTKVQTQRAESIDKVSQAQMGVETAEQATRKMASQVEAVDSSLQELQAQRDELSKELEAARQRHLEVLARTNDEDFLATEREVEAGRKEVADLKTALEENQKRISHAKAELNNLSEKLDENELQRPELEEAKEAAEEHASSAKANALELKARAEALAREAAAAAAAADQADAEAKEAAQETEACSLAVSDCEQKTKELQSQIEVIDQEQSLAHEAVKSTEAEIEQRAQAVAELVVSIQDKLDERDEAANRLDDLTQRDEALGRQVGDVEEQLTSLHRKRDQAERRLEKAHAELAQAEKQVEAMRAELGRTTKRLRRMELAEAEAAEQEAEAAKAKVEELARALEEARLEAERKQEESKKKAKEVTPEELAMGPDDAEDDDAEDDDSEDDDAQTHSSAEEQARVAASTGKETRSG